MAKTEVEFMDVSVLPWRSVKGYPPETGAKELIISEDKEAGTFTRLLKLEPGTEINKVLSHEWWEEVYIIEGGLICNKQVFSAGMVAVRPPGMKHGPFKAPVGALCFEVHYKSKD